MRGLLHASVSASRPYVAPAPAGSTEWRLLFATNGGANYVSMAECQFRTAAGVAETPSGGTATASSVLFLPDCAPEKAVDGLNNTGWYSNQTGPAGQWWAYAFASTRDVVQVMIRSTANSGEAAAAPTGFDVQRKIDGVWTTKWSVSDPTPWSTGVTRTYTAP